MSRVLLVDDDAGVREALAFSLEEQGFDVTTAEDGRAGVAAFEGASFDLVLTDLRMPGLDGFGVLDAVRARDARVPVVVITAHGSVDAAAEAMRRGASDFLEKPVAREVLRLTLERTLRAAALADENAQLKARLETDDEMIAVSGAMRDVLEVVDRVADTDATVLLSGESGSGKEVIARRLHARSRRAGRAFVAVNCSALPKELLESELFGHARGAFTGATRDRKGRFVEAEGGTLFLDEIGDLDLELQAKLLRALEERVVDVVGGAHVPVDVRIITATHRDLNALVAEGRFREDLFFRLHVLPIALPPLRARADDVAPLFRRFAARAAAQAGRAAPEITPALEDALRARPWPGNVRELLNVATRLVLTARADQLDAADLATADGQGAGRPKAASPTLDAGVLRLPDEGVSLEALERAAVLAALAGARGNRSKAARFLRVPRHVLLYRIEKYGIADDEIAALDGRPEAPLKEPPS
jgi:two-component system NtrC family response regulator